MAPDTAGQVALAFLGSQLAEMRRREREARVEAPDGVHKMRVATRRLRSGLATYRPLFDRKVTDPLREELRWLGSVLGDARDVEVTRSRLMEAAQALPLDLRIGPVLERIHAELTWHQHDSHIRLLYELDGLRYRRLLDRLDQLVKDPPTRKRANRPAYRELRLRVQHSVHRVEQAAERADGLVGAEREHALHDVRKSAKRARYAAESAVATLGRPAETLATRMEDLQKLLGEVQDSVSARDALRQIAATADLAGESTFTYGVLYADQRSSAEVTLAEYPAVLARATDPSL
jgi:CHAD domain-containing protein